MYSSGLLTIIIVIVVIYRRVTQHTARHTEPMFEYRAEFEKKNKHQERFENKLFTKLIIFGSAGRETIST